MNQEFFTEEARLSQNNTLIQSMPFLYHLIYHKLCAKIPDEAEPSPNESSEDRNDDTHGVNPVNNPHEDSIINQAALSADGSTDELRNDPELRKIGLSLSEEDVNQLEGFGLVRNTNPTHCHRVRSAIVSISFRLSMLHFMCVAGTIK